MYHQPTAFGGYIDEKLSAHMSQQTGGFADQATLDSAIEQKIAFTKGWLHDVAEANVLGAPRPLLDGTEEAAQPPIVPLAALSRTHKSESDISSRRKRKHRHRRHHKRKDEESMTTKKSSRTRTRATSTLSDEEDNSECDRHSRATSYATGRSIDKSADRSADRSINRFSRRRSRSCSTCSCSSTSCSSDSSNDESSSGRGGGVGTENFTSVSQKSRHSCHSGLSGPKFQMSLF